ncbi:hypothetical protein TRIHO_00550 [Tritonibacter horizontis]|uniref:Uncharacterized protein n=1 Tax=Tritonibacter horizontis TaxID=1768241 RepID=A0A132C314_9RHOB|nr:hypothetical protein TRIHO_00550 [Tritonibacter horizontis]
MRKRYKMHLVVLKYADLTPCGWGYHLRCIKKLHDPCEKQEIALKIADAECEPAPDARATGLFRLGRPS